MDDNGRRVRVQLALADRHRGRFSFSFHGRERERETRLQPFLFSPHRRSLRLNLPSHLGTSSFVLLPSFIFLLLLPVRRFASSPTSSPLSSPRHRFLWRTHACFRYFRRHPAERLLIKLLDDGIERPTAVCVIERKPSRRFVADQMDKWSESVWMKRFFFLCLFRPQRLKPFTYKSYITSCYIITRSLLSRRR